MAQRRYTVTRMIGSWLPPLARPSELTELTKCPFPPLASPGKEERRKERRSNAPGLARICPLEGLRKGVALLSLARSSQNR